MPLPKSINAYTDVRATLDAAVAAGGARVTFDSPGKATHFAQRANRLRKLVWDAEKTTAWDEYQFLVRENIVLIQRKALPTLEDLDGNPLTPVVEELEEDGLLEEAEAFKRRLRPE